MFINVVDNILGGVEIVFIVDVGNLLWVFVVCPGRFVLVVLVVCGVGVVGIIVLVVLVIAIVRFVVVVRFVIVVIVIIGGVCVGRRVLLSC